MAENAEEKFVYVRLNYTGYIPVLNVNGPIRSSWVKKEQVKELIRAGYDVEFLNPKSCPEFYKQIQEYRKYVEAKDYVGAKRVFATSLDKNPNSVVEQAINASEGKTVEGEQTTQVIPPAGNDAVVDALASVGEAPVVTGDAGEPVVTPEPTVTPDADAGNEFSADMAGLEELDDSATGDTEFTDEQPAADTVVVHKNNKKNRH